MINYLVVDKNTGSKTRVKDPYNDLESLGRYLLMKEMKGDEGGNFKIDDDQSVCDFVDYRISHYQEFDESTIFTREDMIEKICTSVLTSVDITDVRTGNLVTSHEVVFILHSMYEIFNESIYFQ